MMLLPHTTSTSGVDACGNQKQIGTPLDVILFVLGVDARVTYSFRSGVSAATLRAALRG